MKETRLIEMRKAKYLAVCLIGFPIGGIIVGIVFFNILNFVNGPYSDIGREVSIIGWGLFGLFAGAYGVYFFLKLEKAKNRYLKSKNIETPKSTNQR